MRDEGKSQTSGRHLIFFKSEPNVDLAFQRFKKTEITSLHHYLITSCFQKLIRMPSYLNKYFSKNN